jgi:uncharacterized protein (DUF427 family)
MAARYLSPRPKQNVPAPIPILTGAAGAPISKVSPEVRMNDKPVKIPGPDHPIIITANPNRVIVRAGGRVIADTRRALLLREASYPGVNYIPRADADMSLLERSDHATYCPYKGDCGYFSIPAGGEKSRNAAWSYENPYGAVASIKGHLAFYPDRIDGMEERPER